MKNITDYFGSPTKTAEKHVEDRNETPKGPDKVVKITNTSAELPDVNKLDTISNKKLTSKKKRKKSRVCRSPDPVVSDVAELLSSNLHFLSPDNMKLQEKESVIPNTIEVIDIGQGNENKHLLNGNRCSNSKPNAFQFLMDSRHKVIGTNSPGKEMEPNLQLNDSLNKEVLAVRRNILNDWAERKGMSKRKRTNEEVDEAISHKLDKRAKRLKKLLKAEGCNVTRHKRRIKRLSSSSDSPDSAKILETEKDISVKEGKEKVNFKGYENKHELNKENAIGENSDQSTNDINRDVKSEEINTTEERKHRETVKNMNEDSTQDSTIISPKPKEGRQSLLSFFGITSKNHVSPKINSAVENLVTHKANSDKKTVGKGKKLGRQCDKISSENENQFEIRDDEARSKRKQTRSKRNGCLKKKEQKPIVIDDESLSKHTVEYVEAPAIKEKSRRNKSIKMKENIICIDESSQDVDFTPRRLRSWQMKIKIDMEEHEKKTAEEFAKKRKHIYVEDNSDLDEIEITSESESDLFILEEEDIEEVKQRPDNKSVKVAPIFIKAAPKPKVEPEVMEARKQFLMSGMPSILKRNMEKQQSMEEKECIIFPTISHVQQKCDSKYWDLQKPILNIKQSSPLKLHESSCACEKITNSYQKTDLDIKTTNEKITNIKSVLDKIKIENPDYPVYKSYRFISEKLSKLQKLNKEKRLPKKQSGRKSKRKSSGITEEIIEPEKVEVDLSEYTMWTEKYKPMAAEEIFGNTDALKNLKNWLETWMNFSKEIISKKKQRKDDSSSEFESTDCDSRDSTRLPGNTMVLGGPCGSGKSAAVYAICHELGFNVIEINASSKRTGKRLLQELQEATQSHQVRKQNSQQFQRFFPKSDKEDSNPIENKSKMCVLFVEDIDIVFDQDDGFINALTQLITTSKRPIILTTTDYDSVFVQKFLSQYEHTSFSPLSSYSLATWLQIVCLVEGLLVDQSDIGTLLEYNKGDIRKTLLQLQLWVQSGGEIVKNKLSIRIKHVISKSDEKLSKDDDNNVRINKTTKNSVVVHRNCIRSFEIFDSISILPYRFSLGLFWWNIPNILNIPSFSMQRIQKFRSDKTSPPKDKKCKRRSKYSLEEKLKLRCLADLYDSICFTDSYFRKVAYYDNAEPHVNNVNLTPRDSTELDERLVCYDVDIEFVHDISHYLVNGHVLEFGNEDPWLDMTVPNKTERRWRAKQHVCEDVFKEAIPLSSHIDRRSTSLDYLSCLRHISRSESRRAASNTKRGNRFRNYLRSLGINCGESTAHIANNILREF